MANNGNGLWRKVGITFGIIATLSGVSVGYGQLQSKTEENTTNISQNKCDIKELAKKFDKKIDDQSRDIRDILIAVGKITTKLEVKE